MTGIVPPSPAQVDNFGLAQWHGIFKTPWETLVGIGYVTGASHRMWTNRIAGLETGDGEVSLFGEAVLEPELQPAPPSSNVTFYIVSSSASDTSDAKVWLVDENGDETIKDVTLTGTTPVSIGSYIHCNMIMYLGGYTQNIGDIFVSTKSDAGTPLIITNKVQAHVAIGNGHGNNPCQLCPNHEVYVFAGIDLTTDKSDGIEFKVYKDVTMSGGIHRMQAQEWIVYQTALSIDHITPHVIKAGEKICLTAERIGSGSAAEGHANWDQIILSQAATTGPEGIAQLFS